jgi:hypothetical protein
MRRQRVARLRYVKYAVCRIASGYLSRRARAGPGAGHASRAAVVYDNRSVASGV